ncbi:MAG: ATP-binding protein, partial [Bacteroidota bacterium]
MSKIRVKNFGPIKNGFSKSDDWIEIKRVTVFIGNQGSGKSTIAKLISTCSWIEKALTRGDFNKKWFIQNDRFRKTYCAYHRLQDYFLNDHGDDTAHIEYIGESYSIEYKEGQLKIEEISNGNYELPQIMYVPAERNFISTIRSPKLLKLSSDPLVEFLTEFDNAKQELKNSILLPINNTKVDYDKLNDTINIKGEDFRVSLTEASSGFQSLVPLFLVSRHLALLIASQSNNDSKPMSSDELDRFKKGVSDIWSNSDLTDEQ